MMHWHLNGHLILIESRNCGFWFILCFHWRIHKLARKEFCFSLRIWKQIGDDNGFGIELLCLHNLPWVFWVSWTSQEPILWRWYKMMEMCLFSVEIGWFHCVKAEINDLGSECWYVIYPKYWWSPDGNGVSLSVFKLLILWQPTAQTTFIPSQLKLLTLEIIDKFFLLIFS